jgi:transcriptional regulator with XRE-family HTH domain
MSLYDRVLARAGGGRALAIARLRRAVLSTLHKAFSMSGIGSQSDLARRLRVRRSAVNQIFNGDGNLRISTLAEYLYEMGYELNITLVRSGEPRAAALEGRFVKPVLAYQTVSTSPATSVWFTMGATIESFQDDPWASHDLRPCPHKASRMLVETWNREISDLERQEAAYSATTSSLIKMEMGGV